jgi:hypothetical protein
MAGGRSVCARCGVLVIIRDLAAAIWLAALLSQPLANVFHKARLGWHHMAVACRYDYMML